jgi:hypothetical protein
MYRFDDDDVLFEQIIAPKFDKCGPQRDQFLEGYVRFMVLSNEI